MRCMLTVAYDGTNYGGFQIQKNADTVAGRLNAAITEVFGITAAVKGASRTDAGVHAIAQRAAFEIADGIFRIPLEKLPRVLNAALPPDIAVKRAEVITDDSFSVVKSAKKKTYVYRIDNGETPSPAERLYAGYAAQKLDITAMREAAAAFIGRHDFAACQAKGGSVRTTVREIYSLDIDRETGAFGAGDIIKLRVSGNGFLYNMVRIIAGTLIETGQGRFPPAEVAGRLASLNRINMGRTAEARGLFLESIEY